MSASKGGTAVVVGVGAERGLGAALCRRFAAGGYHVLVAGRTPEKIAQVVKTIGAAGGSAEAIGVDTTREDDVAGLFSRHWAFAGRCCDLCRRIADPVQR